LTIPVSLIHGTKDVLVPFENLNYAREKLTRSDTVLIKIFEGENHFIPWTKKKEIVSELVRLIDLDKVKK
jgi:pimeloyl-ACP methyl ester carboxylesterase